MASGSLYYYALFPRYLLVLFENPIDRMFLKLANKVDMGEISDEFETGQIGSLILELRPLNYWKSLSLTLSSI